VAGRLIRLFVVAMAKKELGKEVFVLTAEKGAELVGGVAEGGV